LINAEAIHPLTSPAMLRNEQGAIKVWDEESGALHRELEGLEGHDVKALATFLSSDGQQPRLVAGGYGGDLAVYDPEAGSALHRLHHDAGFGAGLACIASSSAAPHHPRLVAAFRDRSAKVWDVETGEWLADLEGRTLGSARAVAVWKEHEGGHDRIATAGSFRVRVWDGEAFTLLHEIDCGGQSLLAFPSAEGPARLLVAREPEVGLQMWNPEEGRLLHDGINRGCPFSHWHLFESAQGRHLLATSGRDTCHARHPGDTLRAFLDVWDLGEAPAAVGHVRPAHHLG
jgi:WD40 repeat protein